MLWLIDGFASYEICGCNTFKRESMSELWIEKPNGKTQCIFKSIDASEVNEIKEAIDYAIEHKETVLRL